MICVYVAYRYFLFIFLFAFSVQAIFRDYKIFVYITVIVVPSTLSYTYFSKPGGIPTWKAVFERKKCFCIFNLNWTFNCTVTICHNIADFKFWIISNHYFFSIICVYGRMQNCGQCAKILQKKSKICCANPKTLYR